RCLKESCPQPIPGRSLRRSGGGKRGVCEGHNRIVSMLGAAMRNRLTEEHMHDALPLMLVCGFLACFVLSKVLLKHVGGHQCPFLPRSSRSRIAWSVASSRAATSVSVVRARACCSISDVSRAMRSSWRSIMSLWRRSVASLQELRPFQDRKTVLVVGGVHA